MKNENEIMTFGSSIRSTSLTLPSVLGLYVYLSLLTHSDYFPLKTDSNFEFETHIS